MPDVTAYNTAPYICTREMYSTVLFLSHGGADPTKHLTASAILYCIHMYTGVGTSSKLWVPITVDVKGYISLNC